MDAREYAIRLADCIASQRNAAQYAQWSRDHKRTSVRASWQRLAAEEYKASRRKRSKLLGQPIDPYDSL